MKIKIILLVPTREEEEFYAVAHGTIKEKTAVLLFGEIFFRTLSKIHEDSDWQRKKGYYMVCCVKLKNTKNPRVNPWIFLLQRSLGFNPGTISAPSERPVLSRPAGTRFEPRSGDLHKLPFERFLFPIPEKEQLIPTGLNQIFAFRLGTGDPYGAQKL